MMSQSAQTIDLKTPRTSCSNGIHQERTVCGTLNSFEMVHASFRDNRYSPSKRPYKSLEIDKDQIVEKIVKKGKSSTVKLSRDKNSQSSLFVRVVDEDKNYADSEKVTQKIQKILSDFMTLNSSLSSYRLLSNKITLIRRYGLSKIKTAAKWSKVNKFSRDQEGSLLTAADSDDEANCDVEVETINSPNTWNHLLPIVSS
ncbi:unnamed protein product [Moneuplotes crassus]|uniref:Uncharacterized protein n=1 Tax=Euplotes crassus TaxID=5936 RepID=A0AAD2D2M2_EUPCR|nr:unnamed protein product [Moneuplotes crassus]